MNEFSLIKNYFTVPAQKKEVLQEKLSAIPCRTTLIGEITQGTDLILSYQDGTNYHGPIQGYDHFLSN